MTVTICILFVFDQIIPPLVLILPNSNFCYVMQHSL